MARTTVEHVDNAFGRYVIACRALGYDTTDWQLTHGSVAYDIAYVVGKKGEWGVLLPGVRDGGKIGWTRTTAYDTLTTLANAMEDFHKLRNDQWLSERSILAADCE